MTTICANCTHHLYRRRNRANPRVWYNRLCDAVEREPSIDPVTGEEGFVQKNDLGRIYVTKERLAFCRDINLGNCEYFSPTPSSGR